MNKKIISAILCVAIFMLGAISVAGISVDTEKVEKNESEKSVELTEDEITIGNFSFFTLGPLKDDVFELASIEGNQSLVDLISDCMNNTAPAGAKILPGYPVIFFNKKINLTLHYKKDLRRLARNRKWYTTTSAENIFNVTSGENETVNETYNLNEKHSVKVTNFSGTFVYLRPKIVRGLLPRPINLLWPARFLFIGTADNVEYLPLPI